MKNKIFILIISILILLSGCTKKEESLKETWRFVHEENNGSIQDVYVKEFEKLIEEKSNGEIDIEIYTVGQIGDATQQCELLQNGAVDLAIISPGNIGTIVPENQLFSLHFLFTDDPIINQKILNTSEALNIDLSHKFMDNNIKVLSYWSEGSQAWTTNKPVNIPEKWNGIKMRTMPSPMIVESYKAYGANPTPVPYMEVYSGLQLHMIDGQENPISAIEEMKFYEVQKYLTLADSNFFITSTCINPQFYNNLSTKNREILEEVMEILRVSDIEQQVNGGALEKIKKKSDIEIVTITEEERESYREEAQKAYIKYGEFVGKDGVDILNKLIEEVERISKENI